MAFDTDLISFSAEELEQLNASETDPAAEWQGMPEFDQCHYPLSTGRYNLRLRITLHRANFAK